MKKKILVVLLMLAMVGCLFAESFNDIVEYVLSSYSEQQAKNFISQVNSNGAFYLKKNNKIYVYVLSKGYGLTQYEYILYSLESKKIITPKSSYYSQLKNKF